MVSTSVARRASSAADAELHDDGDAYPVTPADCDNPVCTDLSRAVVPQQLHAEQSAVGVNEVA